MHARIAQITGTTLYSVTRQCLLSTTKVMCAGFSVAKIGRKLMPCNIPYKSMYGGDIWWSGQSALWIGTGDINESVYIDILATHLLPCMPNSARYSLLQDNVRPHTANHTMAFLAANNINIMQNYPAHLPDFNAIEHIWTWMKQNVAAKSPTTCA